MKINYLDHLPDEFKASAIQLYFNSLKEKLGPVLGDDSRAQEVLESNLATKQCLVAICDQNLVGVLGIQTDKGGFINPTLNKMVKVYGKVGGIFRLIGLALLHHKTASDELYVDGVAVADEMRGKGIGSQLFELLERIASKKGIRTISVEVIDSNPRAKALYERLGFVLIKQRTVWPCNLFFNFPFRSAALMVKMMDYPSSTPDGVNTASSC